MGIVYTPGPKKTVLPNIERGLKTILEARLTVAIRGFTSYTGSTIRAYSTVVKKQTLHDTGTHAK